MATTSTTLMTWAEFEQLPDGDGFHRELIEGELQTLPPAKLRHSLIAHRSFKGLSALEAFGLAVFIEAGYKLSEDRATWLQPDVSVVRQERVAEADEDGYLMGAPDLAVEVVSPSESASDLRRKVALYLKAGSQVVWVAYPRTRTVDEHLPNCTSVTRGVGDTLSLPQLAPGWEFPVAKLFED